MEKFIVYKYTSPSHKCYIGITNDEERRKAEHYKKEYQFEDTTHFANAIRKYGYESFGYEVIDAAQTLEEVSEKEKQWIKFYDSVKSGYNIRYGGIEGIYYRQDDRVVQDIQSLLKNSTLKQYEIAAITKTSTGFVSSIKNGFRIDGEIDRHNHQSQKGELQSNSKLINKEVETIKTKLAQGVPRSQLQKDFDVSKTLIQLIATNQIWTHIGTDYEYIKRTTNGNAKLTREIVAEIKKQVREAKLQKKQIYEKYSISKATLRQITSGKTWKDVL